MSGQVDFERFFFVICRKYPEKEKKKRVCVVSQQGDV